MQYENALSVFLNNMPAYMNAAYRLQDPIFATKK